MSTQPTAVLVHGAFADASGYAGVIRGLRAEGVSVRAPMNPLRGLAFEADAIARFPRCLCSRRRRKLRQRDGAISSLAARIDEHSEPLRRARSCRRARSFHQ